MRQSGSGFLLYSEITFPLKRSSEKIYAGYLNSAIDSLAKYGENENQVHKNSHRKKWNSCPMCILMFYIAMYTKKNWIPRKASVINHARLSQYILCLQTLKINKIHFKILVKCQSYFQNKFDFIFNKQGNIHIHIF